MSCVSCSAVNFLQWLVPGAETKPFSGHLQLSGGSRIRASGRAGRYIPQSPDILLRNSRSDLASEDIVQGAPGN